MVMAVPFGNMLNWGYSTLEDHPYGENSSEGRLPATQNAVPTTRVDALHVMHLTDPNGVAVTFVTGEALPAWALPYR